MLSYIVKIDSKLSIASKSSGFERGEINIDQTSFIENVAMMQTRELNPSNYVNLFEFDYIKSWIENFSPLTFKKVEGYTETKKQLSEDVGVGLAMSSIGALWDVVDFKKIDRTGRRPDFEAILNNGDRLIVESKGTGIGKNVVKSYLKGYMQKNVNIGRGYFERIVSVSYLRNERSTVVYLVDPPSEEPIKASRSEVMSAKAYEYSKLFSVYGFSDLSRYFNLLSKRFLQYDLPEQLLNEKLGLLEKILNQYKYRLNGVTYFGQLRRINSKNFFLGVNEDLLYLETFLSFKDLKNLDFADENKKIRRSKKGFLLMEFKEPELFGWNINITDIPNNYSFLTISDIDEMSGQGFEKYLVYLFTLNKFDFVLSEENSHGNDMILLKNDIEYYVEVKKMTKKDYFHPPKFSLDEFQKTYAEEVNVIFITNADVRPIENLDENIKVWDRTILKIFLKNSYSLDDLI